jgi:hypothetical protein
VVEVVSVDEDGEDGEEVGGGVPFNTSSLAPSRTTLAAEGPHAGTPTALIKEDATAKSQPSEVEVGIV